MAWEVTWLVYNQTKTRYATLIIHQQRIAYAIRDKVKEELDCMEQFDIIIKYWESIACVNSMVTVQKGGISQICIDHTDLNKVIRCGYHPTTMFEEVSIQTGNAN